MEMNFHTDEGVRFRKVKANIGIDDECSELEESDVVDRFKEETQEGSQDISPYPWEEHGDRECLYVPSFWDYIKGELTRGYSLDNDELRYTEKQKKINAFLKIPIELEKFLFYGTLQCLEAFCHLSTFLPIRLLTSVIGLLLCSRKWTASNTCDFLKAFIVTVCSCLMTLIDTSVMYHQVRGQGVIKLYIFYNMLEVADKLFSSFGQATTLNVAFNSHTQALLAIMMSNNFVELKGSVFKKFAKANLFQMSCSDVRERFHIFTLLAVVVVRNMMAVNWKFEHFMEMLPDLALVTIAEIIVDWLKHAFITKFNEIPAEVYQDFTITIAFDVIRSRDEKAFSDYSDQVSRRMVNGIVVLGKACGHVKRYRELQEKAECEIFRKRVLMRKSKSAPNSPRISLVDFSDVLHQTVSNKGFTVSDLMSHWDELNRSLETTPIQEPRRTKSLAIFKSRRDNSLPSHTTNTEKDEKEDASEIADQSKNTPRKRTRTTECESLSDVQAYTMLGNATEPMEYYVLDDKPSEAEIAYFGSG
uniref:Eukaryotic membrane protein n=1 Tax=Wuchereria bancrofti TaxID=6293 RepID=A0A1I8EFG0_WUCBA